MRKSRGCCDGTSARILLCVTQYVHVVCTPSPYIFIEKHTISDRNSLSKNNSPRGTTLLHPSVSPTCQRSLTCLLPQMSISHLNLVKCRIRMMCLMCPKTLQHHLLLVAKKPHLPKLHGYTPQEHPSTGPIWSDRDQATNEVHMRINLANPIAVACNLHQGEP